ncbi:hypothetical protein GGX14DRAFT_398958 [Mycena pura]|uniref:Uncharacterized protein n=1 Tax=Mycena pura TaxID=153505 RepID=A0AAD6VCU4_9AGAR|nr:hypothetical protein GGX14DRAFT_398958 [Mycena pura]
MQPEKTSELQRLTTDNTLAQALGLHTWHLHEVATPLWRQIIDTPSTPYMNLSVASTVYTCSSAARTVAKHSAARTRDLLHGWDTARPSTHARGAAGADAPATLDADGERIECGREEARRAQDAMRLRTRGELDKFEVREEVVEEGRGDPAPRELRVCGVQTVQLSPAKIMDDDAPSSSSESEQLVNQREPLRMRSERLGQSKDIKDASGSTLVLLWTGPVRNARTKLFEAWGVDARRTRTESRKASGLGSLLMNASVAIARHLGGLVGGGGVSGGGGGGRNERGAMSIFAGAGHGSGAHPYWQCHTSLFGSVALRL